MDSPAPTYRTRYWKCHEKEKCFIDELAPRLGEFDDCFPRGIGLGDVDGFVEIGGKFLLIEWKCGDGKISTGQNRAFVAFCKIPGSLIIGIRGDVKKMNVEEYRTYFEGCCSDWEPGNLEDVKKIIRWWVSMAGWVPA
jgi:hypothetical protein